MDDAWLGGDARPVELLPGLQPVIEMGARQYSSVIGRFLETDPVESGVDNDSNYPSDPGNASDLCGAAMGPEQAKWCAVRSGAGCKAAWDIRGWYVLQWLVRCWVVCGAPLGSCW